MEKIKSDKSKIVVRQATRDDIDSILQLNRESYPAMAEDNVVWSRGHLESHQRLFPQGQFVACIGKKVVGAAASLIVDFGDEPLRHHTWSGITDSGFF